MRNSIKYRLFLAFLSAAFLAVFCMFVAVQWSIDSGFFRYVNVLEHARFETLANRLEEAYAQNGSWDFLRSESKNWHRILATTLPEGEVLSRDELSQGQSTRHGRSLDRLARHFEKRIVLMDRERNPIVGSLRELKGAEVETLLSSGRPVGYLALQPQKQLSDIRQLHFVKQQRQALIVVGVIVLLLVTGFSLPLANRLVRPVRSLATASHRMAAGEFSVRVPVTSTDELGQLAGDFNALALTLEKNEQARRQWVGDISHELRTPLTALCALTEALEDGIRHPTPETIRSLNTQALRLSRLVDDLYQLSLSDLGALNYRKESLDPCSALIQATELFRAEFSQKGITMTVELPEVGAVSISADAVRMQQLFGNILNNSLKYTDAGGELRVTLKRCERHIQIDFMDSAPGVPEAELPKLFERLYRLDRSRNRDTGGAGLGLAICRNIVEAHDGSITAQHSPLGGVWLRIALPLDWRCL